MKKIIFTLISFLFVSFSVFAQTSTTPEVPRNYKPKAKDLAPMPDSITNTKIFPVLGKYEVIDAKGEVKNIEITIDDTNKGIVWISGLSENNLKAYLKQSPATYRIISQANNTMESKKSKNIPIQEGTLVFDNNANKVYINIGSKYNEDNPMAAFADLNGGNDLHSIEETPKTDTKKVKQGKKGTIYTGTKIVETVSVPMQ